jgi:hypothetical protein
MDSIAAELVHGEHFGILVPTMVTYRCIPCHGTGRVMLTWSLRRHASVCAQYMRAPVPVLLLRKARHHTLSIRGMDDYLRLVFEYMFMCILTKLTTGSVSRLLGRHAEIMEVGGTTIGLVTHRGRYQSTTLLKRSQSLLVSISFYAIVSFSLLLFHCFLVLTNELVEDYVPGSRERSCILDVD